MQSDEPKPVSSRVLWLLAFFFGWATLFPILFVFAATPFVLVSGGIVVAAVGQTLGTLVEMLVGALCLSVILATAWLLGRYAMRRGAPAGIWASMLAAALPTAFFIYSNAAAIGQPGFGILGAVLAVVGPPAVVAFESRRMRMAATAVTTTEGTSPASP